MKKLNLKNEKDWSKFVKNNTDFYGRCCIDVAKRAMEIIDKTKNIPDDLILQASRELKARITGFQAGCIASIISQCHTKGEEFRRIWNKENQIGNEGEKAKGVLNPALLEMKNE